MFILLYFFTFCAYSLSHNNINSKLQQASGERATKSFFKQIASNSGKGTIMNEDLKHNDSHTKNNGQSSTLGFDYKAEDVFADSEPWEPIETKIVAGSFAAAFFFLIVLGTLINIYFL